MGDWTFFSNYGHVLVCLARNGNARLRDVAQDVGITERAVQKIVKDLQAEGFISVRKQGRCNRYRINRRKTLRHGLVSQVTVGKLLALIGGNVPQPAFGKDTAAMDDTGSAPEPETEAPFEPVPEPITAPVPEPSPEAPPAAASKPGKKASSKQDEPQQPIDLEQGSLF